MSTRRPIKQIISQGVISFFILLWVYAATAKLLEFDQFFVQLSQSPVLTSYAEVVVWLIPGFEILLAVLLIVNKTRRLALTASYLLMCMFTVYIIIILNYADYIPCSCGGILEELDWTQHLFFNLGCIILALIGLYLDNNQSQVIMSKSYIEPALILIILTLGSCACVVILFLASENTLHYNNQLNRRYPHHPATLRETINLGYNSYYLAGINDDALYLGNTTAPLHLLKLKLNSKDTIHLQIQLSEVQRTLPFQSIKTQIHKNKIYLYDSAANILLAGNLNDLKLDSISVSHNFSLLQVTNDSTAIVRTRNISKSKNELAVLNFNKADTLKQNPNLLEPQHDGIFSTDGMLLYNPQLDRTIYTYYYRNQFLIADNQLNLIRRTNTIDTTSSAQLKIKGVSGSRKLANVPHYVNKHVATYGRHLFIHSDVLGVNDTAQMLEDAFIIDVYDLLNYSYRFSFYLYKPRNTKLKDFKVYNNEVFALIENQLLIYTLKNKIFEPD
ncbi:MauE/DoxX family redox-associated membrane protein [Leeuwenhoekiella aestuarii]|uniref:Putative membrane protein YphA (DoxX/SURF4 family) n=1 Tax=Leeuwenhoekiella aestuarii TaxID=2249426 RepID=A0A4Q0NSD8_9FLAO|nr:MauE/DoxX family redox-associated membrane protein [Leeuwenhoekiella aestuarii]RXG13125.1 putative membrane protein YphA (DoxX/SURF4 family) [Leeuwenhoekiella aestuarii]